MQLSTGGDASTWVFRSGKDGLSRSLKKDELFESGKEEDMCFDVSSQLVLEQRCFSGSSEATRHCLKTLLDLKKSDDEYLATVFHDEICFRRKLSGFHVTSLRRMVFQQWKTFAENRKVMRLRTDGGLKSLLGFLHGLTPEEREDVLPLLVQARHRVEDVRIRKEEIRKDKFFTFRSQLLAETSTRKKKELVNDWLNLGPAKGSSEDEFGNGLFLREKVKIDDEAIRSFINQKIREFEKTAAVWKFPTATRCWVPISLPMPLRHEKWRDQGAGVNRNACVHFACVRFACVYLCAAKVVESGGGSKPERLCAFCVCAFCVCIPLRCESCGIRRRE